MRTIAFLNQKGGVGKTTTTANLAAALARKGKSIAAMDLDPQSHLTMHLGIEPGANIPGVYEMLTEQAEMAAAAINVDENLDVIPACIDLAGAEIELVSTVGREQLLNDRISSCEKPYDYVIMDCPPSLGLLTLNALAAADEVIIPLQPHFLALQGFGKLLETISLVQKRVNPRLTVGGVILCMYESSTRLAGEVSADVADFLSPQGNQDTPWAQAKLYETRIRRNIKLAECPSFGQSIFKYEPSCAGAEDYSKLADEFLILHNDSAANEAPNASAAENQQAKTQQQPQQSSVETIETATNPETPNISGYGPETQTPPIY